MTRRLIAILAAASLLLALAPARTNAYAVLAHEAIIDSAWEHGIRPLLLARFPNATHDELRTAHGYAYGGAIIQDLGYYPHGSHAFSDIVHYIRTADFIRALLRDAREPTISTTTHSRSAPSPTIPPTTTATPSPSIAPSPSSIRACGKNSAT